MKIRWTFQKNGTRHAKSFPSKHEAAAHAFTATDSTLSMDAWIRLRQTGKVTIRGDRYELVVI